MNLYRWTIYKDGNFASDNVFVQNNAPTLPNAGVDQIIYSNSTTLNANAPIRGYGRWTALNNIDTILNFTNNLTQVISLNRGTHTFRWSIINELCSASDDVNVIVKRDTTTWNGTTWSDGAPNAQVHTFINGRYTIGVNDAGVNLTTKSLTILPNGELTVNLGKRLTVNGDFVIKSQIGKVGSFISNGTLVCTGKCKMEMLVIDMISPEITGSQLHCDMFKKV